MKTRIAVSAALMILMTGCVTPTGGLDQKLARYKSEAKVAAYVSTALYLEKHPEDAPVFHQAVVGIDALMSAQQFDPVVLAAYLRQNLPIKELKSERAGIFFMAGVLIFQEATGTVTIETPPIVKAFATGIREGIDLALTTQNQCP